MIRDIARLLRGHFFVGLLVFIASQMVDTAITQAEAAQMTPQEGFVIYDKPRRVPEIQFENGEGKTMSLADFRGKVVLLNIWATWCTPCRHEMPTLDRLQARLGGPEFEVVALSIDRAGFKVVEAFYKEIGIRHLRTYLDKNNRTMQRLFVMGIPTTLLIDKKGREVGRLVGPAEWDSPEIVKIIEGVIAGQKRSQSFEWKYELSIAGFNNKALMIFLK
jgi:thiol-disulfide isomerase/thioredoxin